jgi:hypothetical protein
MLHRTLVTSIFVWGLLIISGCSVFMAANQPASKNLDLFSVGTPRDMLLAEFGLPSVSETKDGKRREIFTFKTRLQYRSKNQQGRFSWCCRLFYSWPVGSGWYAYRIGFSRRGDGVRC